MLFVSLKVLSKGDTGKEYILFQAHKSNSLNMESVSSSEESIVRSAE